ncbi:MAG: hypothetical protein BWY96_01265 [Spirochaetes bacterium ADurb.BinA120]|nr:MAG: hypothetical protein BWY96_01265 [Spirochaetes bacterium ADurb.BinA120]
MDIPGFLVKISPEEPLEPGTLLRRIGSGKDQQGIFSGRVAGGLVLREVIDLRTGEYIASEGLLSPETDDALYRYSHSFASSPVRSMALEVLTGWSLLRKHPDLRDRIIYFTAAAYSAEQILEMKKTDTLYKLFVPIQQRFGIGKYAEKVDLRKSMRDAFRECLEGLHPGDHLTYIANLPEGAIKPPSFFSAGTKPHQETHWVLQSLPFSFNPTHGGHIKLASDRGGRTFIVDAGSNYVGRGNKTSLITASAVVDGLYRLYEGYYFIPVEGRGAFGTEQSY